MLDLLNPFTLIDRILRRGRGKLITWPLKLHTGAEVESFLRSFGVQILDRKITGDNVGVWVSDKQAKYADGLLRGGGFAITSKVLSKPITPKRRWGRAAKTVSLVGLFGDLFGVGDQSEAMSKINARPTRRGRSRRRPRR